MNRPRRPPRTNERPRPVREAAPTVTNNPGGRLHEPKTASLFGIAPVLSALKARAVAFEHIVIVENLQNHRLRELLETARIAGVAVRRVPRPALDRLAGPQANHQGVVAIIAAARYADPDDLVADWVARIGTDDPPLGLVLDGVEDPHNLGALIRTVECAGGHGIIIPERRAVGLTETVAKSSAGAMEYVPVAKAVNLTRLLEELKQQNIWTVGTAADAKTLYTEWDWRRPTAIVLGGEGAGLHRLVASTCDVLVKIPLRGHTESLNVSVAGGILLYEALRQRSGAK
jgi:23S rRNA (guanosine2251-2'-O)-methyltransferase